MNVRPALTLVLALLVACSSDDDDETNATPSGAACGVAPVNGAAAVSAEFANLSASVPPPVASGGALAGRFRVTRARVYLPAETAAFIDPTTSRGTVTGWAAFEGTNYRLFVDLALTIASSVGGPQEQRSTSDEQGTFATSGTSLTLTPGCGAAAPTAPVPEYSYSVTSTGATLIVKTKVPPFNADSYVELDAVPE